MFTTTKAALAAALSMAGQVVAKRDTIPILQNVLLEQSQSGLVATMTDLDLQVSMPFEGSPDAGFSAFTVPAHLLADIVKKLPDGAIIDVKADKSACAIASGRSRFKLQTLPAPDFPSLSGGAWMHHFTVDARAFATAIGAVKFAISTEETRYYLTGIYMHPAPGGIYLVATDGHRLAKRYIPLADPVDGVPGVIIPRRTAAAIEKMLPQTGDVEISVSDSRIAVSSPDGELTSKLVDGTYPDYDRVIPCTDMAAEVEKADLCRSVDRVVTVLANDSKAVKFAFAGGVLTLTTNNPSAGSAVDEIAYNGDAEITIGLNGRYVSDAVASLPDGTLILKMSDPGTSILMSADGDHKDNFALLMPMRI